MRKRMTAILVTVIMLALMIMPTTALADEGNRTEHYDYNITLCISVDIKAGTGGTIYSPSGQLGINMSKNGVFSYTAVPGTGYAFDHWTYNGNDVSGAFLTSSTDPNLKVKFTKTGNVINYVNYDAQAVFKPLPQRSLTVNVNGQGTVAKSPAPPYYDGSSVTLTANPADGWQFSGWSGDASGSSAQTSVTINGDKSVTAAFTPLPTYTLTVNTAGSGTVSKNPDIDSYWQGRNVTLTANAAGGWRFGSWSGDASGTSNPLTVSMSGNKAITANFVKTYNVTISTQGYGHFDSASKAAGAHDSGSTVNLNDAGPDPDSVFYMFLGWKDNGTGQFLSSPSITVNGDCSYTAVFTDREHLDLASGDHGHLGNDLTGHYASGTKINLNDSQPTPQTGYTVDCWKEFGLGWSGSGTEVSLAGGQPIITIGDSNWFKVFFKVANYTISYNLNNGTVNGNPSTYTYFDNDFTLNNPTRPGYTFTGWTGTDLSGRTMTVTISKHSTGNRTYTANWNANLHNIYYYVDGTLYQTVSGVAYNTALTAIDAPTKGGYTFSGWSGLPGTMPDSNVTVTGTFGVNQHNIYYYVDGTLYQTVSGVAYNTALTAIDAPAHTGYTFSGWSGLPGTMPDSNVTVTGTFGVNHHNIYYYVDGALYQTVSGVAYNTALTAIDEPTKTGYTFSGWNGLPTTMPDTDVTVTGTFGVNQHNIYYYVDGTLYQTVSGVAYNTALTAIDAPTKAGYTFSGWNGLPSTMPDTDVTVTGTFAINYHNIYYYVDGTLYQTVSSVAYNTALTAIDEPTKAGYTFSGWNGLPSTMPDTDVTVTGTFAINYHNIYYYVDGTLYQTVSSVAYNTALTAIDEPTQTGYTFSGWNGLPTTMPDTDVTVTGAFGVNHHNIYYYVDGTLYQTVSGVAYNTALTAIDAPAKTGYTFSGWGFIPQTMPDSDVTVNGTFAVNHHDIIYTVDGTEYYMVKDVAYGTGISPIAAPTKEGYTFSGWSAIPQTMPDTDVTVTGTFIINTYKVRFFRTNGTTQIGTTQTVDWGSAAVLETAPAVTGYTFADWALTGDDPTITTSLSNVKENIDAVATYNIRTYTVTFVNYDGTTVSKDTVNYGDDATPPADPAREGYTFTGWSPSYDNITGNTKVTAQFTINTYTVRFVDYNGTVITTETVDWNTDATAPASPSRDGYTFNGWDTAFTGVKSNLTVTAQYTQTIVTSPSPSPSPTATVTAEPVPTTGGANAGWMWWLLLVIPAGLLLWFIFAWRRRKDEEDKKGNNTIG